MHRALAACCTGLFAPAQADEPGPAVLLETWTGHRSEVHELARNATGDTLASVSTDGWLCTWDTRNGTPRWRREIEPGCWTVAFLPDGKSLLTGGADGRLRLWRATDGEPLATYGPEANSGHGITCLAIATDGRTAVTGGFDAQVRLWDLAAQKLLQQGAGHSDTVWCVAFLAGPDAIVSGSFDGTLRTWAPDTLAAGKGLTEDSLDASWQRCLAVAPDGKSVLVGGSSKLARWLWPQGTARSLPRGGHTASIVSVALRGDGKLAATGGFDGRIEFWDLVAEQGIGGQPAEQGDGVWAIVWLDAERVASAGNTGDIKVWRAPVAK